MALRYFFSQESGKSLQFAIIMGKIREAINRIYNDKKEIGEITQSRIADFLGCKQSTVSQYLSGARNMSADVVESFCDALGVKLSDLEQWNPDLAKIRLEPAPTKDAVGVCNSHLSLLQRLDDFLDGPDNEKWADFIKHFLDMMESGNTPHSAGGRKSEKKNDSPAILLESGRRIR